MVAAAHGFKSDSPFCDDCAGEHAEGKRHFIAVAEFCGTDNFYADSRHAERLAIPKTVELVREDLFP